jgi:hypothetical protein
MLALLLLSGCGVFAGQPDPAKVRTQVNAWRIELNGLVDELRPIAPALNALCPPTVQSTECQMARAAWETARAATEGAQALLDVYEAGGVTVEAVDQALSRAERAGEVLRAAAARLTEVANGLAQDVARPGAAGERPPAPEPAGGPAASGPGQAPGDAGAGEDAREGGGSP